MTDSHLADYLSVPDKGHIVGIAEVLSTRLDKMVQVFERMDQKLASLVNALEVHTTEAKRSSKRIEIHLAEIDTSLQAMKMMKRAKEEKKARKKENKTTIFTKHNKIGKPC